MMAAAALKTCKLSFERADVLVFDPVASNRTMARTALRTLGFQSLMATSVFSEASAALNERMFDLLVADVTQDPVGTCALVRRLRDGDIGRNPFMHIVLMAWKLDGDLVKRALNCGADDLVTRPFSVDFLGARLHTNSRLRKPFVITSNYIGPDRRNARPGRHVASLFEVPNLLLAKARDPLWSEQSANAANEVIKEARTKTNAARSIRCAFQLAFLARCLRESIKTVGSIDNDLARLDEVAKDLQRRVGDGAVDIENLISALLGDIAGARSGANLAARVDQIDESCTSLLEKVNPGRKREELLSEVAAAFAAADARRKT